MGRVLMAFVYCVDCDWQQDDFWDEDGYTPFRQDIVDDLKASLFKDRIHFDVGFFRDFPGLKPDGTDDKGPWLKGTTYVAWDLRRLAKRIENMLFRTSEEFDARGAGKWKCPKCGGNLRAD
jgi:hypothetical protein